jgi:hypothetical protein
MSTIRATLEPDADGTLHLPLPPELRQGKVHVVAILEPANAKGVGPSARVPDLHPGALQPAADFDEPLPDEFWQGSS